MELCMGHKERDRLKVMEQVATGAIGSEQGARRLAVTRRQMQRLVVRYRRVGDRAAIHGLRGRRPSNAKPPALRAQTLELVRTRYADFGPTLAAETLAERHGIVLSAETLRQWLIAEGVWRSARKLRRHRRRRPRRACFGELVQIDTSIHDWLEGRGPTLMLITMIDDASGRKQLRFFLADTSEANMEAIARWIAAHGRPLALYSDWAGHFRRRQAKGQRPSQTQIERALGELDTKLICAGSPQAKGRVERSHGTDQDRLVKGLRLAGVRTLAAANRYLEEVYQSKINAKFAKAPADAADAHRSATGYDLEAILCVQERRVVQNDWTVSIDGGSWQIEPGERTERLRGQRVIVERRRDGSLRLRWQDRYLKFHRAAGALEQRMQTEAEQRAVDSAALWTAGPPLARRPACPQGLNNSPSRQARGRVIHRLHSPDDAQPPDPPLEKETSALKKPVRIPNCTRKPKPNHPWR